MALLHAHGDADKTILIGGGNVSAEFMVGDQADYPAARDSVAGWARLNGCAATTDTSAAPLDLVNQLPGAETAIEKWTGCPSSGAVELWTIHGADHAPSFRPDWALDLWGWLSAHPRS